MNKIIQWTGVVSGREEMLVFRCQERGIIYMQLWLIVSIIIAMVVVVFALQNAVPITVSFLAWNFESSLALVLLITIALGVLMSTLASVPAKIKNMKIISSQKKKIQELENALPRKEDFKEEEKDLDSKLSEL